MARLRGELVVSVIFASLLLVIVTAERFDVPYNGYSSYVDDNTQALYGDSYPLITVELLSGNQINATQKRFEFDSWSTYVHPINKWNISLNYRTKGGSRGRVWMNETNIIFDVPFNSSDDWIIFDCRFSARVKYDDILWNRITKQLKDDFTVFSKRWILFVDARQLAKAGEIGYDRVLSLIRYLSTDRDFPVWFHICDFIYYLNRMLYDTAIGSNFQRFILNATSSLVDEAIAADKPTDMFEFMIIQFIWRIVCNFGHRVCVQNSTQLFQDVMRIENETIRNAPFFSKNSPRLDEPYRLHVVYCVALANSLLESDWKTVLDRLKKEGGYAEASSTGTLFYVLSCSRNETFLRRFLEFSLESEDRQYFRVTMRYIDSHPESNYAAWKWLKRNSARVDKRQWPGASMYYLRQLAYTSKTRQHRQEVVDFFDNYPFKNPSEESTILRIIDSNIGWMDNNLEDIGLWFNNTEARS